MSIRQHLSGTEEGHETTPSEEFKLFESRCTEVVSSSHFSRKKEQSGDEKLQNFAE